MIKRFYILLLAIVASVGMMNAKVTWNSSNVSDIYVSGTYQSYSKEGVELRANADMIDAWWQNYGDESMSGISFNTHATGGFTFSNTLSKNFTKIVMTLNGSGGWDVANLGSSWSFYWNPMEDKPATVTWTGNASTVDLATDESHLGGENVKSIVFYFVGDSEAPDPTYTVALKAGTANADKVTLSATSAIEGATVTVTPDDEYEITAFSAYYVVVEDQLGSIYDIDATLNTETGAYSFTMPAYDVTIEATIALKPVPEGDIYAGFTATAGSGGFDNEGSANLVDNKFISSNWTKWCTNDGHKSVPTGESESCWWIDFEASAALYPTGYILTTGNDTGSEHGRNPKNWVLKAKLNAGDAWTTIATVTNDVTMKNKSFKDYKFFVDQSGSYKYFRFEVFANQGASVMQLCQLRLIGTDTPAPAPAPTPAGALNGAFTINANGDKIVFSRGNLQAKTTDLGANWTWDFAPNQWSLIGNAVANNAINGNKKVSANGTVDLFGWSTAATYYGINESWKNDDYAGDFVDWGALMGTEWRTLSRAEFYYIVYSRTEAYKKRGQATVNGVPGYVLLPDAWTLPSGLSFTNSIENYTTNLYDGADWTAMENAGAVFLPAAGVREGTDIYQVNLYGWYWASTPNEEDGGKAYYLYFDKSSQGVTEYHRWKSKSVRLVTAAPIPPYEAVMNLINAIGTVELTAECKAKIDAARAAFDALSDGDKAQVTNIATLTTAEAAFDNVMDIWLSGDCDAILWKDTTLTIRKHAGEGNGAMADYTDYYGDNTAPWFNSHWYNPQPGDIVIKSVTIEEGVTHIGENAFGWMSELKAITIPSSVTSIGEDAFYWSKAVDDIYLTADPSNLTWVLPYSADNQFKPEKATLCHVPADLLTAYQETFGTLNMTFVGDLAPVDPAAGAAAIVDLINAIGTVEYTDECKAKIDAAREAYDKAVDAVKDLISADDLKKLTDAETEYADLKAAADQAAADPVIEKINAIPQPVELKLATRDSIESARAAYDALTADQQALVTNYGVLTAAEATWATLNPGGGMPAGALSGKFTINADGDQISFAKGNLQATTTDLGETWTWGFAANQWDFIGNAAANNAISGNGTVSANGTVDLFGWSTPTTYYGIHNSANSDYYSSEFREWGENITGAEWKTLSPSDWIYIISNRADAAQKQGQATVNGVNGYIFLPDEWELPTGLSFTAKPNNWTANVYDGADWTAMENAGAVFLPKSPWRSGNTINTITYGYYWSSDYNNYSNAMAYYFKEDASITGTGTPRYAGICVRLVTAGAGSATPLDSALAVKDLIEAIPAEITLDAACVKAIEDARAAYDALSDNAKGVLDDADVTKLTDAEQALKDLNQAVADEVIAKINNIPTTIELKLATRDSIESARAAYDALNAAQQALVTNYTKLTNAEAALAALNPGVPPATPLDSAQAVKDLIDVIPTPVEYPTSGPAIAAALVAYQQLSDAAKGALDAADVQKMTDAAAQYAALDAIAAIDAIPAEIVYDPLVKTAIETARDKFDKLIDASKALVDAEVVAKLTNAEQAWAILVAKVEHNVSYIGKDGELKHETVALLHIPDPAPDFNGYEFVRWDVKGGDFLEEGLRVKAVYTPIITTNPQGFDTLAYNGLAQELVKAGVAKDGHIEYSLYPEESESWSAELPKATIAGVYAIYYKLVREGHADYIASEPTMATIAKVPVTYVAPVAYDTLVYTASNQTLIAAGQTGDGTFEYSLNPALLDSWSTELPQAMAAGTYSVYYRVQGDINHLDSTAVDPIAVTIAKAELTATADDKNVIYGDAVPAYTVTYAGWQGDDDAAAITGTIAFACEYAKGSPVGEYTIVPSGVDAANYTISFVNGKVIVNRKSAKSDDITAKQADNEMLVYTAAVNKPTIQAKDTTKTLIEGTDYTLSFVGRGETQYAESATAPIHVGDYTAIVAFVGNYKDTLTVDFAIAKAPLTITAENKEVIFGENAPVFTVRYDGFLGTDTATVLTGTQAYACEYVRGDNVGDYTIIPSGVDAHDYVITFVNGTLTVNRKSAKDADIVAAQLAGEKLIYTNAVNRPTIVVTDTTLQLTETKDYTLSFMGTQADNTQYAESATAPIHVGNYTAIVAFVGNYKDTLTVDFKINQAPLTITANDTAMIYGDDAPAFTVRYDGFLGTDDNSVLLGTQGYSCVYEPGSPIGTYAITPKDVTAYDYEITFVDGTLTVNKAHVYVSGAEAQIAKFADGHANAVVLEQGILNGIKLNDPIAHVTTAAFSSADVAENLTITLFYELTGDAALLNNYHLDPTSDIFTTEGVIIEPFIPDDQPEEIEDEEATVEEGIEIYAYGYCDGSGYSLKYHLESGNPDQYKIDFADSRFTDVDWTNLVITGKDGTIDIDIPVDLPTGDYDMTVYFRDSRFDWLESRQFNVTFHVNLPETYVRPLFDNVIALVDTCNCLTDIQWYWRANSTDTWVAIPGANGYYYHSDTKLEGEYFVSAKMNGEPTYTCGQADMETLYGNDNKQQNVQVKAYPNPVVTTTIVTIEGSENFDHNLRVVNLTGVEVLNTTFEGNETTVDMNGYVTGNYMISVDGIVVKVMKK